MHSAYSIFIYRFRNYHYKNNVNGIITNMKTDVRTDGYLELQSSVATNYLIMKKIEIKNV